MKLLSLDYLWLMGEIMEQHGKRGALKIYNPLKFEKGSRNTL
jgi:hypothetical protein